MLRCAFTYLDELCLPLADHHSNKLSMMASQTTSSLTVESARTRLMNVWLTIVEAPTSACIRVLTESGQTSCRTDSAIILILMARRLGLHNIERSDWAKAGTGFVHLMTGSDRRRNRQISFVSGTNLRSLLQHFCEIANINFSFDILVLLRHCIFNPISHGKNIAIHA